MATAAMCLSHQLVLKECVCHTNKMERKGNEGDAWSPPVTEHGINSVKILNLCNFKDGKVYWSTQTAILSVTGPFYSSIYSCNYPSNS